jgi:hypothetical protein
VFLSLQTTIVSVGVLWSIAWAWSAHRIRRIVLMYAMPNAVASGKSTPASPALKRTRTGLAAVSTDAGDAGTASAGLGEAKQSGKQQDGQDTIRILDRFMLATK